MWDAETSSSPYISPFPMSRRKISASTGEMRYIGSIKLVIHDVRLERNLMQNRSEPGPSPGVHEHPLVIHVKAALARYHVRLQRRIQPISRNAGPSESVQRCCYG